MQTANGEWQHAAQSFEQHLDTVVTDSEDLLAVAAVLLSMDSTSDIVSCIKQRLSATQKQMLRGRLVS